MQYSEAFMTLTLGQGHPNWFSILKLSGLEIMLFVF